MRSSFAAAVRFLEKDFSNFCDERLHPLGLSGGLLYFVLYLGRNPGCTPGMLADGIHVDSGYAARSLYKLEQLSYITRRRSHHDGRVTELFLTPQGDAAYRSLQNLFFDWDELVLSPLDKEERETLCALLQKVQRLHTPVCRKTDSVRHTV